MDKDMKIVVTVFTTILTISIGVFVAWKWMDAAEDGTAGLGVAILYLIFILPCSIFIGIFAGLNLVPFLISKKEREGIRSSSYKIKTTPFASETAPTLVCSKCNNKSTDFDVLFCPNCGTKFSTKTKDDDEFGLF